MKRFLIITILLISIFGTVAAQPPADDDDERGDRVEAAKVAYITSKLELNTQQAQQFWPVYNEFEAAKKKIRKQLKQLRADNMLLNGSEDQMKADIKKMFALRQEELDLEKAYVEKFLKVITARQLAEFYRAEKEFTKMLLKRLGGKRRGDLPDGK